MTNPCNIIKIDKNTNRISSPNILLTKRNFDVIGKVSRYTDWDISIAGNNINEISFDVPKYIDKKKNPIWDDLVDLKLLEVKDFGRFEISVDYSDSEETTKSVVGQSLEVELGQIYLNDFHVNDEEVMTADITELNQDDFTEKGDFIPTVFYLEIPEETDEETAKKMRRHSLLHRVLADKAPHWKLGYVTKYIALDEDSKPELSEKFSRIYTVDGTSIYDFLTGEVAEESNVIFIFDTFNRIINCYSLIDIYDPDTGELLEKGIGEDTTIFVSKEKLANEITISSDKDSVKNCFKVEGGDDLINAMVRVVNVNGSNYIWQFADFQYNDMSEELVDAIKSYQVMIDSRRDEYYSMGDADGNGKGIYPRLVDTYEELYYLESSKMPDTSKVTEVPNIEEEYNSMIEQLTAQDMMVAVSSVNNYNENLFVGVTNNVVAYAQILVDSRYEVEEIDGTTSFELGEKDEDGNDTGIWKGKLKLIRVSDENDYYPKDSNSVDLLKIKVTENELEFAKQKVDKSLSKGSMLDIDWDVENMTYEDMKAYFDQYSLNRLISFYDGYNTCISILADFGKDEYTSEIEGQVYNSYYDRLKAVTEIKEKRQDEVDKLNDEIIKIEEEQKEFQAECDFKAYLDKAGVGCGKDLYLEFCAYRREDTYSNSNYISDGYEQNTSKLLEIAKNLVNVAEKEAKKACVLQRTISTSLNNLFVIPEFEPLYDKFALFNYIRVKTDDEIFKLRLLGIDFNGSNTSEINVTFAEKIESIDGKTSDLQSIIQQASSISTSYSSTVLQAQKGQDANDEMNKLKNYGLDASKMALSNNENNEVVTTGAGIICRRMDDEGYYGSKELRVTGNTIYLTDNSWETVRMAIGEIKLKKMLSDDNEEPFSCYGVIADAMVAGYIETSEFVGGKITIANNNTVFEVDPNKDNLLNITNNGNSILKVDKTGNLLLEGEIKAKSGKIANFNIGTNELYTDGATFANTTGSYFGTSGLRIGSNFKVDSNGNATLNNLTANSGTFKGNITSSATISGGTLSGATISGGSISIGDNFFANSDKVTIKGEITATSFKYSDDKFTVQVSDGISIVNKAEDVETSYYIKNKLGNYSFLGANSLCLHSVNAGTVNLSANDQGHLDCNKPIYMYTNDIYGTDDYVFIVNIADDEPHNLYFGYTSNAVKNDALKNSNTVLRGQNVKLQAHSGGTLTVGATSGTIAITSDENLKDMYSIDERYEQFFMNLIPQLYSYKNTGHRKHAGYGARQVEQALLDAGLTTEEFAGLVIQKDVTLDKDELGVDEDKHFDELYSLRYEEFGALYAYMLQKALKKIDKLEAEINELKGGVAS